MTRTLIAITFVGWCAWSFLRGFCSTLWDLAALWVLDDDPCFWPYLTLGDLDDGWLR